MTAWAQSYSSQAATAMKRCISAKVIRAFVTPRPVGAMSANGTEEPIDVTQQVVGLLGCS